LVSHLAPGKRGGQQAVSLGARVKGTSEPNVSKLIKDQKEKT